MSERATMISEPLFSPEAHTLNVGVAITTKSLNASVVFNHIFFWIRINKQKNSNQHDGKTWMYQTIPEISCHFPYLSEQQVKDALSLLVKHNYIIKGNYSKNKFEKTNWYALKDEGWLLDFQKISTIRSIDPIDSLHKPDPTVPQTLCYKDTDNKTDNKTDNMSDPSVGLASFFFEEIKKINPKIKTPNFKSWAKDFQLMLTKDGYSAEEIRKVIEYIISTKDVPSNSGFCWANVILSSSKLREKFAHLWGEMKTKEPVKKKKEEEEKKVSDEKSNREWAIKIYKKIELKLGEYQNIIFKIFNSSVSVWDRERNIHFEIGFNENGFKEIIEKFLLSRGIL